MTAVTLIVARYALTHSPLYKHDVPAFADFAKWVRAEFGVVPGERALIEARSLLRDLAEEQP